MASNSAKRRPLKSTPSLVSDQPTDRPLLHTAPPRVPHPTPPSSPEVHKLINTTPPTDKNDESLNRWKASLGLNSGTPIADANDPRKCIIKSLALEVQGRDDVVVDLSAPGALDGLKDKPFTIKEGANFRIKAVFQVQHEVLSGLKYLQVVKRKGIRVSKDEEMLVSPPPGVVVLVAGCLTVV